VSDPAARARRGPAPVRWGRSRHGCHCGVRLSHISMFGGEKRRVFVASNALDCDSDLPEDPVPFVRKMLPQNESRSREIAGLLLSWKVAACGRCLRCRVAAVVRRSHLPSHQRRRPSRRRCCICARHRVRRYASLRPRCARPSGLDGACAQMIGGQLRDGRRMLFPSGTDSALIDPLDGLEGTRACV
jgi:hypothetical protein